MESRTLEITLHHAKDLNKVNLITKMDVYVVVSISGGDKNLKQKTNSPVDHNGDANPNWDFPMKFTVEEGPLQQNRLTLDFKLICERALGDKDVGEVNVPIKELFDSPAKGEGKRFLSYQVRKPSGKPKGQLTFSYIFSEKTTAAQTHAADPLAPKPPVKGDGEPLTAYPAGHSSPYPPPQQGLYPPPAPYPTAVSAESGGHYPPPPVGYPLVGSATQPGAGYPPPPGSGYPPPQSSSYAYPPQSSTSSYAYLPQSSTSSYAYPPQSTASSYAYPPQSSTSNYGYPPQPSSYGYPPQPGYGYPPPPVQQPPKKNNKFGMGLGAGLLGGAIGGLLIGDMISDAADFDCGGGFDF